MLHIKKYILVYTVVPLIVLFFLASYYRFFISSDYLVGYETICNPYTQNCYVECEDDDCTEKYYYKKIERYAVDIMSLCGKNITDCEAANSCQKNEKGCVITYCDSKNNNEKCEALSELDYNQNTIDGSVVNSVVNNNEL